MRTASSKSKSPARGPYLYLKKKNKRVYSCLRTASFGSPQGQEPSQGSRSVLKIIYLCLRTASFGTTQSQETSQGFRSVLQTAYCGLRTASFRIPSGQKRFPACPPATTCQGAPTVLHVARLAPQFAPPRAGACGSQQPPCKLGQHAALLSGAAGALLP